MIVPATTVVELALVALDGLTKMLALFQKTGEMPEHIDLDDYKMKSAMEILEEERAKREG